MLRILVLQRGIQAPIHEEYNLLALHESLKRLHRVIARVNAVQISRLSPSYENSSIASQSPQVDCWYLAASTPSSIETYTSYSLQAHTHTHCLSLSLSLSLPPLSHQKGHLSRTIASEMASPPAPPGAASSTPSSSFSFPNLPIELNDQIFQHLHLVDHQINFTLAVMPAIGKIQASRLLVKALTDNFFLHRKNRNSLFGKGGIAGHKANNPDIVPTQHDRNLVNSTATTFKELLSVAHQQDNKDWIRRLEESKQAETAKYLKNAVLSSRRMRRGDLKPNAQRKCTLGLATTDTRDYTQLLEEHDPVSAIWAAISDAKAEDEAKEIVSGNNLEALEKLCRALLKDGREFRHVCRGSCDPELSLYTTKVDRVLRAGSAKDQRIFLPVCSGCRALYLEGTMIGTYTFLSPRRTTAS